MSKKYLVKSLLSGLLLLIAVSIAVEQSGLAHAANKSDQITISINIQPTDYYQTPAVLVNTTIQGDTDHKYSKYKICTADNSQMQNANCDEYPADNTNVPVIAVNHTSPDGSYSLTPKYFQARIETPDAEIASSHIYKVQIQSDRSITIEYNTNDKISDNNQQSTGDLYTLNEYDILG